MKKNVEPWPGRGFGPHAAAMPLDDSLHDGKPHARPLPFPRIQPVQHPEDIVGVLHFESDAVVAHGEGMESVVDFASHLDRGGGKSRLDEEVPSTHSGQCAREDSWSAY